MFKVEVWDTRKRPRFFGRLTPIWSGFLRALPASETYDQYPELDL
jgi:hypothetical protein